MVVRGSLTELQRNTFGARHDEVVVRRRGAGVMRISQRKGVATRALVMFAGILASASAVASVPTAGTDSSSVSRLLSGDFYCNIRLRVYDPEELTRLFFLPTGVSECSSEIPGVTATFVLFPHEGIIVEGFPSGFHGPADILNCRYDFYHSECPPSLDTVDITWYEADGPSGPLPSPPTICPVLIDCSQWPCGDPGPYVAQTCGDADSNGKLSAIDALIALRAAVSIESCALRVCDADRDASVDATDALLILQAAVGLDVVLACPAPCTNYIFPS